MKLYRSLGPSTHRRSSVGGELHDREAMAPTGPPPAGWRSAWTVSTWMRYGASSPPRWKCRVIAVPSHPMVRGMVP